MPTRAPPPEPLTNRRAGGVCQRSTPPDPPPRRRRQHTEGEERSAPRQHPLPNTTKTRRQRAGGRPTIPAGGPPPSSPLRRPSVPRTIGGGFEWGGEGRVAATDRRLPGTAAHTAQWGGEPPAAVSTAAGLNAGCLEDETLLPHNYFPGASASTPPGSSTGLAEPGCQQPDHSAKLSYSVSNTLTRQQDRRLLGFGCISVWHRVVPCTALDRYTDVWARCLSV